MHDVIVKKKDIKNTQLLMFLLKYMYACPMDKATHFNLRVEKY